MTALDSEIIRAALAAARDRRLASVEVQVGEDSFSAAFLPFADEDELDDALPDEAAPEASPDVLMVKSPAVGYYREPKSKLVEGEPLQQGSTLGDVLALGIANEIPIDADGILVKLRVAPGEAVEYGQILAEVRRA